ncbi:unnamed protein product, partial [Durusdinium trenchii]
SLCPPCRCVGGVLRFSPCQVRVSAGDQVLLNTKASEPYCPGLAHRKLRWLQGALGVSATWDMRGCELRAKGTHLHAKLEDHEQRLRIDFSQGVQYLHVGKNSLTFELLEKQTLSAPKVLGKGFLLFSQLPREVFPQMISRQVVLQDVGLYWGPQQELMGIIQVILQFQSADHQAFNHL